VKKDAQHLALVAGVIGVAAVWYFGRQMHAVAAPVGIAPAPRFDLNLFAPDIWKPVPYSSRTPVLSGDQ